MSFWDSVNALLLRAVSETDPSLPEEEEEEEEEEDESRPLPATVPATGFACKRKPCILIFDSLGGGSRSKVGMMCRGLGHFDLQESLFCTIVFVGYLAIGAVNHIDHSYLDQNEAFFNFR